MKISTEIHSVAGKVGEEKAIEYLAKAGFTGWDFSMFGRMWTYDRAQGRVVLPDHPLSGSQALAFARKLRQVGLDNGIVCNQSHAPFPIVLPDIMPALQKAIECTAEAGGEICVIHPDKFFSPERNADLYRDLLPFAKDHGVKLATENMFEWHPETQYAEPAACGTPESFRAHMDALKDDDFVACLDVGHAEIHGNQVSAVAMIEALGNRLQALHLHDNDGSYDQHQIPFSGNINFSAIMRALKKNGYQGWLTLEAACFLGDCTAENTYEAVVRLAESAKRLSRLFEET